MQRTHKSLLQHCWMYTYFSA